MIPIIDYSKVKQKDKQELERLHDSCSKWGLFYLDNSSISDSIIEGVFKQSRQFFELSSAKKQSLALSNSKNYSGYLKVGEELTNGLPDLKESLEFAKEESVSGTEASLPFMQLYEQNQWPNASWIEDFTSDVTAYHQQVEALGSVVLQGIGESLSIPTVFRNAYQQRPLYFPDPIDVLQMYE